MGIQSPDGNYIDTTGAGQDAVLEQLRVRVEVRHGLRNATTPFALIPQAVTRQGGGIFVADATAGVTRYGRPRLRHSTANRFAIFTDATFLLHMNAEIAALQALVTAGTATQAQTTFLAALLALPAPAPLDSSWETVFGFGSTVDQTQQLAQ